VTSIPFIKAHGAMNDFLLTWRQDAPEGDRPALARAICERHTGIGADGWMLVDPTPEEGSDGSIQLYNSDGSEAEISGNGTRCAAALLVDRGHARDTVRIRTGAGLKILRVLDRRGVDFNFEMNMGRAEIREEHCELQLWSGHRDSVIVWVGNPQCAILVDNFDFDWREVGVAIEHHPKFPNRTNVSFLRRIDQHTIDVRFWERGAGETMSSGTGSTGAAAAAIVRGWVESPVVVRTPAGPIEIRQEEDMYLVGPAQLIGQGEFYV
jgi:diaminopimelate epimerase